jgi:hypothetical protein
VKIRLTLTTPHGHVDRQDIAVEVGPDQLALSCQSRISIAVKEALDAWCLLPGDTVKIEEIT